MTPSKTRVLLADDHDLVRAGIRNAIEDLNHLDIIGEVGDGPQLLQAIATMQPDLILIDVTMPDFDPIREISGIRVQYPQLLILVVSAYDDDVYVQGLLRAGVNGYHLKDQPLGDLRLAIERILGGQRWISSPLLEKLLQPALPDKTLPVLSTRQQEILRLLVRGADNRTIASQLNLSVKTVENHLTRLYRQLKVQSRLEAANFVRDNPALIAHSGHVTKQSSPVFTQPPPEQVAILVVDDNRRYRTQIRRMIAKVYPSAVIYTAENSKEALQMARQVNPRLALVDVVLGEEDGISCARRLKREVADARIILMSAYPDREFHRRGLEVGATAFLDKKDLDAATLKTIIQDAVR